MDRRKGALGEIAWNPYARALYNAAMSIPFALSVGAVVALFVYLALNIVVLRRF